MTSKIEPYLNEADIIMMKQLMDNVERGAKFLDNLDVGDAWYKQIDTEKLNIADGSSCIAGQLFFQFLDESIRLYDHGFHYMLEEYFDGDSRDAAYYGFNLHEDVLEYMGEWGDEADSSLSWVQELDYFSTLNCGHMFDFIAAEWVMQIEKRKANAGEML